MSVRSLRSAVCLAAFATAALLAACQGNIGTGSGLPAAPSQSMAPGRGGSAPGTQSRQRVVEGAVYLVPGMGEIPLPALEGFSVTISLASPAPISSAAYPGAPNPGTSGALSLTSRTLRGPDSEGSPSAAAASSAPNVVSVTTGLPAAAGTNVPGPSASPLPSGSASPAPSGTAGPVPSGSPGKHAHSKSEPSPSPQPSGPKIDTKLTVYPDAAPAAPTPAPTGNVQTYLKRVAIVRGYLLSRTELTLFGLGAVRFTSPPDEQSAKRGFTVAVFDQSKKHHDRLVAWDANAALSDGTISTTASPRPILLKKGVGYAFLLYGDQLVPAAPASSGSYPPPGNNPFVTPVPGGAAANPYATATPNNPNATPTAYNPYAAPSPPIPYVPTISPH
jgi:hypothetical protein